MHKLDDARHAGDIIRYHSWPTIQQQTNAHHTWNVIRIYYEVFGVPSANVMSYIVYHDVGELATGDISFVVKRTNPEVKTIIGPIEDRAMQDLSEGHAYADMLGTDDKLLVKICDLLEMLEFSLEEMRLGNRHYGWMIFENIYKALHDVANNRSFLKVWSKASSMMTEAQRIR